MKVEIIKIVEGLEMQNSESHVFFNTRTGDLVYLDECFATQEELESYQYDETHISLPSHYDIHEYDIMRRFILTIDDETYSHIADLIRGKGAFRRFKSVINRLGIAENWYAYKMDVLHKIAIEWCHTNSIDYEI